MNKGKTNEVLAEIVHLASAAMLQDDPKVKAQAVADISHACASLAPVETVCETPKGSSLEFCGLKLVRFAGKGVDTTFVGMRRGDSFKAQKYEIDVVREDRPEAAKAIAYRDGVQLFSMWGDGINFSKLEKIAIAALRKLIVESTRRHRLRNKTRKAKKEVK